MSFGTYTVTLDDGSQVTLDIDQELTIGDISSDMDKAAAQIAFWGKMWGEAERQRIITDAAYRHWGASGRKRVLAADPKMPEWKAKDLIEADANFVKHKAVMAQSMMDATVLRSIVDAFRAKASMLQSKGAMMRAELDATGMTTRATVNVEDKQRLTDGVRNTFKKGVKS